MTKTGPANKPVTRALLIKRDGDMCFHCGRKRGLGRYGPLPLVIHHVDHNPENNDPSNLRLACPSCNMKEGRVWRKKKSVT